jgi:type 1 glutamine amidotransferase
MTRRLLLAALGMALCAQAASLRVLIVTGSSDEPFHHWKETTAAIQDLLAQTGRFDVNVMDDPRLVNAAVLWLFDVVVLNYNGPRFPVETEGEIEAFVRSGHGFVAVHQASYGAFFGMEFREKKWHAGGGPGWKEFARMIGATWAPEMIGHARRGAFQVEWKDCDHAVSQGLPAGFAANDELYHRMTLDPAAHVLADAMSSPAAGGTGNREPLIWTNSYGKGRVFFTPLGHDATAWAQPGMRTAFARGVEWAASGQATIPPREK